MNQSQLELQCKLYKLLLDANAATDQALDSYLSETLKLVVAITGAKLGYIELKDNSNHLWHSTYECSEADLQTIKRSISNGIIADTIASGETVVSSSAFSDDRFQHYRSVQAGKIQAVLCSPIKNEQIKGVIYLQGDTFFGKDLQHKTKEAELFSKHIAPLLRHFKSQAKPTASDLRNRYNLTGVIGESEALIASLKEAMMIADLDVTVLLKGETGVGKNLLAQVIHNNSNRKYGPFVHLNCANLPELLLESELFGAMRGAHSAAHSDMKGKISAAENGTLFLDEIGELSVSTQAKLLQFLEEGIYFPLGSKTAENPDVRIIAASNLDFEKAVKSKSFRPDLYFRICVFPITLPSLRQCREDIRRFVAAFARHYGEKYQIAPVAVAESALADLEIYDWPGNVRELQYKIQQAVLRARQDGTSSLESKHFFPPHDSQHKPVPGRLNEQPTTYREGKNLWEKTFITDSLQRNQWNVTKTAQMLNLSRSQLNKLMQVHRIERDQAGNKENS
jgi:Nif-specific regulatory protein